MEMKKYKVSYFKKGIGEVEYETSYYVNKVLALEKALKDLDVDMFDLDKPTKEQLKEKGIKDFKIKLIK